MSFSGQNVTSGIPWGSLLESALLFSDLEEIVNGEIAHFWNLKLSGSNATLMMSSSRRMWKTGWVVKRVTDELQCTQREETKVPKMCQHCTELGNGHYGCKEHRIREWGGIQLFINIGKMNTVLLVTLTLLKSGSACWNSQEISLAC